MSYVQHQCPNCGAAVPAPSRGTVRCEYCATELTPGVHGWAPTAPADTFTPLRDPHLPRLWLEQHRYALLGRLGRGEHSDVFLARRDARITELVVVKLLRPGGDPAALAREAHILREMESCRLQGAAHFTRLLPQPVAQGTARLGMHGNEGTQVASALRWRSGFVHTFGDVATAYPGGIPAPATVWLWKRILEQLGFVHRAGVGHGALTADHLLVHARDHGVVLIGWTRAGPLTAEQQAADIRHSARCVRALAGTQPLPERLEQLLAQPPVDAWAAREQLDATAGAVFGPPKYIPLPMPGWR